MTHTALQEISRVVDAAQAELIQNLGQMVSIESVEGTPAEGMPFGRPVHAALEHVLALGSDMGFETHNYDGYVGAIDWGSGDDMIGVLSHVDVVPAGDPSAWNSPAFTMTEKDGYLFGRGVADDKGPLLSALYGMYALKESGFLPRKRVRLIIGTNEETGWGCMHYYLEHCEIPTASFCPDGMFTVVNREKGILSITFSKALSPDAWQGISVRGGEAANLVPARAEAVMACQGSRADCIEKAVREHRAAGGLAFSTQRTDDNGIVIICHGKSAHAMSPEKGSNAALGLLSLLSALDCIDPGVRDESGSIVCLVGNAPDGSAIAVACRDDVSGALTMNLGKLDIINGRITLQLDVRTPVTVSAGGIAEHICSAFLAAGYAVDRQSVKPPLYVPADMPLVKTLCDVYQAVTGSEPVLYSIGGGTYARAFPNCVCFGSVYPGEELTVHSPNERVLLANLIQNAKMYGLAISELTR